MTMGAEQIQITVLTEDSISYDGNVWHTRVGYMKHMGLSKNSIRAPYDHVISGKAETFKIFSIPFFRNKKA